MSADASRSDEWFDRVARVEAVLCSAALADRVEMVVSRTGERAYRAASVDGAVEFERIASAGAPGYRVTATDGRDPLARQEADHLIGYEQEVALRFPDRTRNSYPHAFDSIAQFFDAPHSPDLLALHSAAHRTGGHLGQHGSLGVVQARGPFVAAGAGIRASGVVDRSIRIVDIAPTVAALLALDPHPGGVGHDGVRRADALLRRQDGSPDTSLLDGDRAEHVVVFLLDGCNANLLADVVASGEAPNIAELARRGSTYRQGALASLPTATLANHTTALTGAHPGHSGILHNTWLDRHAGAVPDLLSMEEMFWATRHLSPEVETVFEALRRTRPGSFSSATFEFCDRGADFSSFALVRDGGDGPGLPPIDQVRGVDPDSTASAAYRFMSCVDHVSAEHTVECWEQRHGNPLPALSWCSLALTDEAGHESGPHGTLARAALRDSDARIGRVLAAVERAGALDRTAVLVLADHGMEQSHPELDTPWDAELAGSGVPLRELDGLIYLTDPGS